MGLQSYVATLLLVCASLQAVLAVQTRQAPARPGRNVVFLAGLKGSAHEFWADVFKSCEQSGTCRSGTAELKTAIFQQRDDLGALRKAWVADKKSQGSAATLLLNGYNSNSSGLLSYPIEDMSNEFVIPKFDTMVHGQNTVIGNYAMNFKHALSSSNSVHSEDSQIQEMTRDLQNNPRLDNYLEVAKENGDRLSAIILLDPEEGHTLRSFMSMGNLREESLYRAAGLLEQQLRLVPPERRVCIDVTTLQALTEEATQRITKSDKVPYDFTTAKRLLSERKERFHCDGASCESPWIRAAMGRLRQLCGERTAPQMFEAEGGIDVNRNQATHVVNLLFGKDFWGC